MDFFQRTISTSPLIELVRVSASLFAAILFLWLVRISITRKEVLVDCFTKRSFIAFAFFGVMLILQQWESFGEPLLLWRLPLYVAGATAMTVAVQRKL